jgi:hypothetical protein
MFTVDDNSATNSARIWFNIATGAVGTTTATGSGFVASGGVVQSLGSGWYRCSATFTTGSATTIRAYAYGAIDANGSTASTLGNFSYIWGAQLETGSTATAYQRVVSSFDVTQAGVPDVWYLSFDGTDDGMLTGTITPGIDKAQVFAGVRKLGDGNNCIVETSTNSGSIQGSFGLFSSAYSGASAAYAANLNGSQRTSFDATTFTAPTTNTLTSLFDIAGANRADEITFRVNGVTPTLTGGGNVNAGTGNFLAYPLYIGRRGGATQPYNGRIYSLIVRFGANLSASTILQTETWVGDKTGINIPLSVSPTIFDRFNDLVLDRAGQTIEVR